MMISGLSCPIKIIAAAFHHANHLITEHYQRTCAYRFLITIRASARVYQRLVLSICIPQIPALCHHQLPMLMRITNNIAIVHRGKSSLNCYFQGRAQFSFIHRTVISQIQICQTVYKYLGWFKDSIYIVIGVIVLL